MTTPPPGAPSLVHGGKQPRYEGGRPVNPPLVRASTVLFDSVAQQLDLRARRDSERNFIYGARGNPTNFALEDLVTELEGGFRTRLFPTGLAAIGMVLLACLKPGDHLLMSDGVYEPARHLVRSFLVPRGIECSFFAADGSDAARLMRPNTRVVYAECPGSLLYEMCDLPALAALAHEAGALLVADNTWGSGLQYRPLALGADISVMAATKYLGGHSDVMMGTACATEAAWAPLNQTCDAFGMTVSPDDAWLVLRGARTMGVRLAQHQRQALEVARWLQRRSEVARVFHPALPGDAAHALWLRDCHGSNGLLSFEFAPAIGHDSASRWVDALGLFGIGASWGGYESMVGLYDLGHSRGAAWTGRGLLVRLHIGLEEVEALLADLAQAFDAIACERAG